MAARLDSLYLRYRLVNQAIIHPSSCTLPMEMMMDDQSIECPRCGEVFSMEFTRCPQCGLNMYPEDETPASDPRYPVTGDGGGLQQMAGGEGGDRIEAGTGEALLAVVLGVILAGTVSFLAHTFATRAESAQGLPVAWQMVLFLTGPLGAALGGSSIGVVAKRERLPAAGLGVLVGIGAAALVVLFETRWRLVTAQVLLEPAMLAQYALCLLGGALGGWLGGQSEAAFLAGGAPPVQKAVKGMSWEDLMYRDLLTRVRFNRDTAERLIEYERRLAPEAERYTLMRNAVERLDRDREG